MRRRRAGQRRALPASLLGESARATRARIGRDMHGTASASGAGLPAGRGGITAGPTRMRRGDTGIVAIAQRMKRMAAGRKRGIGTDPGLPGRDTGGIGSVPTPVTTQRLDTRAEDMLAGQSRTTAD